MPVVRVYVPVSRADLETLASGGVLPGGPGTPRAAFAVTAELARLDPGADTEDLEYTAFVDAVAAAARLRQRSHDRRVVASADADSTWVAPAQGAPDSRVALTAPVPLARIASFHIDESAGTGVGAAGDGVDGAHAGVDDLLWYDVTELSEVRSLLDG